MNYQTHVGGVFTDTTGQDCAHLEAVHRRHLGDTDVGASHHSLQTVLDVLDLRGVRRDDAEPIGNRLPQLCEPVLFSLAPAWRCITLLCTGRAAR